MLQAVGVQAVTSYYGMGFKAFTDSGVYRVQRLGLPGRPAARVRAPRTRCTAVGGPAAAGDGRRAERSARGGGRRGARRLARRRAQRRGDRAAPRGPLPHPQGRLSDAPVGTVVADDVSAARGEVSASPTVPAGTLTFARLAWPGYTARIDGAVPVRQGPAGLLTVDAPGGAHELVLAWSPPAFGAGVPRALLGAAIAVGHAVARVLRAGPGTPERVQFDGSVQHRAAPDRRGARRLALTLGDPERVHRAVVPDRAIASFRKTPRGKDLVCHIRGRARRSTDPASATDVAGARSAQGSRGRNAGSVTPSLRGRRAPRFGLPIRSGDRTIT